MTVLVVCPGKEPPSEHIRRIAIDGRADELLNLEKAFVTRYGKQGAEQ